MPTPATPFAIATPPHAGARHAAAPGATTGASEDDGFAALLGEQVTKQSSSSHGAETSAAGETEAQTQPAASPDAESSHADIEAATPEEGAEVFAVSDQQAVRPQPRPLDTPVTIPSSAQPAKTPADAGADVSDEAGTDLAGQSRAAQAEDQAGAPREAAQSGEHATPAEQGSHAEQSVVAAARTSGPPAMNAKADGKPAADVGAPTQDAQQNTAPAASPIEEAEPAAAQTAKAAAKAITDGDAAQRDGRLVSERAPGDVLRAAIKPETAKSNAGSSADAAPRAASGAKPATAAATPSAPAAPSPAPSFAPPPPALDLGFVPITAQILGDASSGDLTFDPTLVRTDTGADPAGLRLDAKADIRTASTLQSAQGPRFTPHSAQTLAAQIAQRFSDGGRVFDIRLDPPELGRVEVRLEVASDNSVRAVLAAERTETLAELQRSARDLERALAQAGLELGEDALTFSLTDDGAAANDDDGDTFSNATPAFIDSDSPESVGALDAPITSYGFLLARAERLDVSV